MTDEGTGRARATDGTSERWTYNALDQATSYTDRDGVQTYYTYDAVGNLTRVMRGGVTVFTARYDSANRLVEARTGGRTPELYEYDERGYPSSRTVVPSSTANPYFTPTKRHTRSIT